MIADPVEQALRLDAACVVVNLFRIPEQPEVSDSASRTSSPSNPRATATACRSWSNPSSSNPTPCQASIKADPTDDVGIYHRVIEVAGRFPVLVRGGGKAPDAEILQRTETLIRQGVAGIV